MINLTCINTSCVDTSCFHTSHFGSSCSKGVDGISGIRRSSKKWIEKPGSKINMGTFLTINTGVKNKILPLVNILVWYTILKSFPLRHLCNYRLWTETVALRCSIKNFVKYFAKVSGNTCLGPIFDKVTGLRAATLLKKEKLTQLIFQ